MDSKMLIELSNTVGSLMYNQLSDEEDADRSQAKLSRPAFSVAVSRRRNRMTIDIEWTEDRVSYVNGDSRMTIVKGQDELVVTKDGAVQRLPVREVDQSFELTQILVESMGWRRQV